MKYEEIKVGESYEVDNHIEKVLLKHDEYKAVMTIDENGAIYAWDKDDIEDFQPIKKELPESGLLVCTDGAIVYRTCEYSGFGFLNEVYEIHDGWTFGYSVTVWRTAIPEDKNKFIKLLEAEAEKRGLGVNAKIKGHADNGNTYQVNGGEWDAMFDLAVAWNKNGRIFHNGIWAEPIKEEIVTPKNYSWVETYCNISSRFFTEKRLKELEDKVEKYSNSVHKETENKKAWWRS